MADSVSTTYADKLIDNMKGIHTLKPNLLEAEVLSGMRIESFDDLKKAASVLLSKGVHRVFISLGRHGVFYADAEGVQRYRCAHPMDQIANATGAGDSFLGALLYAHVRELSLEETLQAAMAVSMLTIQSDATINPLMSAALSFYRQLLREVRYPYHQLHLASFYNRQQQTNLFSATSSAYSTSSILYLYISSKVINFTSPLSAAAFNPSVKPPLEKM